MTLHTKLARQANRRAFTLMEMLIVVAIIVILAGVGTFYILPQFNKAKEDTARIRALGWQPKLTIQQGIIRTLEYLQQNPWVLEQRA